MATDRSHPQPAQAPQPPARRRDTLTGAATCRQHRRNSPPRAVHRTARRICPTGSGRCSSAGRRSITRLCDMRAASRAGQAGVTPSAGPPRRPRHRAREPGASSALRAMSLDNETLRGLFDARPRHPASAEALGPPSQNPASWTAVSGKAEALLLEDPLVVAALRRSGTLHPVEPHASDREAKLGAPPATRRLPRPRTRGSFNRRHIAIALCAPMAATALMLATERGEMPPGVPASAPDSPTVAETRPGRADRKPRSERRADDRAPRSRAGARRKRLRTSPRRQRDAAVPVPPPAVLAAGQRPAHTAPVAPAAEPAPAPSPGADAVRRSGSKFASEFAP
jgi:hypothetical protein